MNLFLGREGQKQGTIDDSRERKPKNVQNEDYLLRQIDEFRDKAKQLQALLGSKEQKVRELEALVNEREDKAEELDLLLKARREEADRLIRGVAVQLQKMIDILDQKMEQLNENVRQQIDVYKRQGRKNADDHNSNNLSGVRLCVGAVSDWCDLWKNPPF